MKIKSKSMRKKSVAVLAGIAIAGAVGASATSLGGITTGNAIGAENGEVTACDDTGIVIDYTTSFRAGEYMVDSVVVSDVDVDCAGLEFGLTLLDAADAEMATASGNVVLTDNDPTTVADTEFTVDVAGDNVSANGLEKLAIVING